MEHGSSVEEDLLEVLNGDPSSYCRLCLSDRKDELEELFPVGQGPRLETIDRIAQCTGIQISQDEDFPSAVCWMCSMSLEEFQWFREKCRRYDVLIRRKRKDLLVHSQYEVSILDDPGTAEYSPEQEPAPLMQIASVQEQFDEGRQSSQSLLEPTTYQPPETEEYPDQDYDDFDEADDDQEELDVKPDHAMLEAFALQFRDTNGESELRTESELTDATATVNETPENSYQCVECYKTFPTKKSLSNHSQTHLTKLPFACKDCGTCFHRIKTLRKHQARYHSKDSVEAPLRIKCDFCPRIFPRNGDRMLHCAKSHPELYKLDKITPPSTAQQVQTPVVERPSSKVAATSTGQTKCSLCATPVPFANQADLEEHIAKLHTNKEGILICLMCPKTFKSRGTLRMHVLNHQGKLPYECKDCGSRFDRKVYLERHRQRYHTGSSSSPAVLARLRCKFCPRLFIHAKERGTHMRSVHNMRSNDSIKREKLTPDPTKAEPAPTPPPSRPELSFGCLQCGKDFPSPAILREHIDDQHTAKKPSTLYEVKPIIVKVEPGTEEECPPNPPPPSQQPKKPPTTTTNLPFKCPRCPKTFAKQCAMAEHVRIHTGKLKYRCKICSSMFHRPNYLEKHILHNHGPGSTAKPILRCRMCSRVFLRIQDRRMHEKKAHGMHGGGGGGGGGGGSGSGAHDDHRVEVPPSPYANGADEGDEVMEDVSPEDVEIRDVVITLERIPDEVLETVDISYCDDDDEDYEEDENDATDEQLADTEQTMPRMNITLHRCPKCLRVFKTRAMLNRHMVYHQSELPFPCDECGVQFARKPMLLAHKERYHSEDAPVIGQRFSCNYCSRIFLRERDRVMHVRNVHVMERTYGAREEEGTPELKKAKLKKKRKDYICLVCNERFEGERSCQRHLYKVHPAESQPPAAKSSSSESPAPIIPKVEPSDSPIPSSSEPSEIPAPSSSEPSEIPAPSETPAPSSSEPSEIPAPSTTPKPGRVKPYKLCRCPICTAIFKNEEYWKTHIQEHPKQFKPHHCEPCLIKRKAGRSNKKVTSVGFKCQYCGKVFKTKSVLRNHQRLHNSELRFPCDECDMKFDRFRLLQGHKERYHAENSVQLETFKCEVCDRSFMRLQDRNLHLETVHGQEEC